MLPELAPAQSHVCASHRAWVDSTQSRTAGTQARVDKERYQQALSEYQQRLTLSEAGMEESPEEPFATFQPQGVEPFPVICPASRVERLDPMGGTRTLQDCTGLLDAAGTAPCCTRSSSIT